jgi:two-component system NarL family sensor kinase
MHGGDAMAMDDRTIVEPRMSDNSPPAWTSLVEGAATTRARRQLPSEGRVVARFVLANLIAVVLLLAGSLWASRDAAEDEAIAEARNATDMLAALLVTPNLDDRLAAGDPESASRLHAVLLDRLPEINVVRVKVWTPDGRIIYSDESRLIGAVYPLGDDSLQALEDGRTRAELSDLSRPENRFERSAGQLLEVYRRVRTPDGQPLLLETYSPYDAATARQWDIWSRFAPISISVLLALLAMQLPLALRMVAQLRATQRERELLQARSLDASTEERRRIAGSLHDGIVQDVSASSLLLAGAADQLRQNSPPGAAQQVGETLGQASIALRESAGSLRSLLVEIYPPNLERAGLAPALADLAARLRPRGIDVRTSVPDDVDLPLETATLLFRIAQESLLNVAKHAGARSVAVTVTEFPDRVVLEVADDGAGFDIGRMLQLPQSGHLGLSVLADLAATAGAALDVRTGPGAGTKVRLALPRP